MVTRLYFLSTFYFLMRDKTMTSFLLLLLPCCPCHKWNTVHLKPLAQISPAYLKLLPVRYLFIDMRRINTGNSPKTGNSILRA